MGWPEEQLASDGARAIAEHLRCPICMDILRDAVGCPVGHAVCNECFQALPKQQKQCPQCRTAFAPGAGRPLCLARSLVDELQMHCLYRADGCRATLRLAELEVHQKKCPASPVVCPRPGCSLRLPRAAMEAHKLACVLGNGICARCALPLQTPGRPHNASGCLRALVSCVDANVATLRAELQRSLGGRIAALQDRMDLAHAEGSHRSKEAAAAIEHLESKLWGLQAAQSELQLALAKARAETEAVHAEGRERSQAATAAIGLLESKVRSLQAAQQSELQLALGKARSETEARTVEMRQAQEGLDTALNAANTAQQAADSAQQAAKAAESRVAEMSRIVEEMGEATQGISQTGGTEAVLLNHIHPLVRHGQKVHFPAMQGESMKKMEWTCTACSNIYRGGLQRWCCTLGCVHDVCTSCVACAPRLSLLPPSRGGVAPHTGSHPNRLQVVPSAPPAWQVALAKETATRSGASAARPSTAARAHARKAGGQSARSVSLFGDSDSDDDDADELFGLLAEQAARRGRGYRSGRSVAGENLVPNLVRRGRSQSMGTSTSSAPPSSLMAIIDASDVTAAVAYLAGAVAPRSRSEGSADAEKEQAVGAPHQDNNAASAAAGSEEEEDVISVPQAAAEAPAGSTPSMMAIEKPANERASLADVFATADTMLHQPTEGDYVILSPDHESFDASAKDGPLRDSTAGVVIAVDNLHPSLFLVRTSENETWRYCKHTLQVVGQPGDLLMPDMAYKGILVQRGPDWYGAKLMGGTGGGAACKLR